MKTILSICTLLMLVMASAAFGGADLAWTSYQNFHAINQAPIQYIAPNGTLSQLLTVNSTTINMTGNAIYSVYYPTGTSCQVRSMATSTKANTAVPVPAAYITMAVNPSTPFVNFSGCTNAGVQIQ